MSQDILLTHPPIDEAAYKRAISAAAVVAAVVLGVAAALGSPDSLVLTAVVLLLVVAAVTLPLSWVALTAAVLVPLQFYINVPGSTFTLRSAVVFIFAAALRALVERIARKERVWQTWMVPAAAFLFAALVASIEAESRYLALRGIYDWLVIFAAAFVFAEVVRSRQGLERLIVVLVAAGTVEGVIGLVESGVGMSQVLDVLRMPFSGLFYQPNLLRERLVDLSFNWVAADRVLPFGTFINDIDYAIFVATMLVIAAAAFGLGHSARRFVKRTYAMAALLACCVVMGAALVLTLKGSGLIAFAGGAAVVAAFSIRRPSSRTVGWALVLIVIALLLALPFGGLIQERAAFLLQREQGVLGTAGRIEVWSGLLSVFAQRPIFGFGLNHAALMTQMSPTLSNGAFAFNNPSAESAYVAALVETGVVGFAALMAWLAFVLKRAYQRARGDPVFVGILAALAALLVGNVTVEGFTTDQNGMLLGMLVGVVFSVWKPQ